ncbi:MAG: GIY-YIG nuclease family protein [Candidatus Brocadiales bacterium]
MKSNGGVYFLYLSLREGQEVKVGKFGRGFFPSGFYIYVGSAQKNLHQRLARHLRNEKSPHWHIDYLLPHAKILSIHVFKASKEWECRLSQKIAGLEGAMVIMKGFGASDCRCPSHLYYFPYRPRISKGVLQHTPTRL